MALSSTRTEASGRQTTVATESKAETFFTKSSILPAACLFSAAVFHGGFFFQTITTNTMNKSPTGVLTVRKATNTLSMFLICRMMSSTVMMTTFYLTVFIKYLYYIFIYKVSVDTLTVRMFGDNHK